MVFDSLRERMGGDDKITPMGIAHHTLFTAKEKLDLLRQLKADATSKDDVDLGFAPEEIDEAMEEVRRGVQSGVGSETVLKGDF
jgi:hypothetical protein